MNPYSSYQGNPYSDGQSRGQNNRGRNGGRNNQGPQQGGNHHNPGRYNGNRDIVGNDMVGYPPAGPAAHDKPNPRYKGKRYDPDYYLKQGLPEQRDFTVQEYYGQSYPGPSHQGKKQQGKDHHQGHEHQGHNNRAQKNPPHPFPSARNSNQGTYTPSNLGPGRYAPAPAPGPAPFMPQEDLSGDIEMFDADNIAAPTTKRVRVEKEHAALKDDIRFFLQVLERESGGAIRPYLQQFIEARGDSPLAAIMRQL